MCSITLSLVVYRFLTFLLYCATFHILHSNPLLQPICYIFLTCNCVTNPPPPTCFLLLLSTPPSPSPVCLYIIIYYIYSIDSRVRHGLTVFTNAHQLAWSSKIFILQYKYSTLFQFCQAPPLVTIKVPKFF